MNHWLVKQEPSEYNWSAFVKEKGTAWTGVRNFQARNFLKTMQPGDPVLFYHSTSEKQIVGIAQVSRAGYPDTTSPETGWVAVDLKPIEPLKTPVSLEVIKKDPVLKNILLLKQSRLSVILLLPKEYHRILTLAGHTV